MHNDYTFQCFIDDIVKKKKKNKVFSSELVCFIYFSIVKIKPQSSCQQSYFCGCVFICQGGAQKKKEKKRKVDMYITKLCSICSATIKVNTPIWNCNPVSEHFFTQTRSRGEKPRIVLPCFMCCNRPTFMWSGGQKKKRNVTGVILATDDWAASHCRRLIMTKMTRMISL